MKKKKIIKLERDSKMKNEVDGDVSSHSVPDTVPHNKDKKSDGRKQLTEEKKKMQNKKIILYETEEGFIRT